MTPAFWRGKRVFLTGHTGFKGSWLSLWLQQLGAEVHGFALPPATTPSLFELADVAQGMTSTLGDIRDLPALTAARAAAPSIRVAVQTASHRASADGCDLITSASAGTAFSPRRANSPAARRRTITRASASSAASSASPIAATLTDFPHASTTFGCPFLRIR